MCMSLELCTTNISSFLQGKQKMKAKANLSSEGNGHSDSNIAKENPEIKQMTKMKSLDVFAGCGGNVLCFYLVMTSVPQLTLCDFLILIYLLIRTIYE